MASATTEIRDPIISETDGRLYVKVPWKKAEHFQGFFKNHGIGSTLHLDPWAREAQLELWTRIETDDLRTLLAAQGA